MAEYEPTVARMIITLMNAQEQEWARISRVLHDEVAQIMSAVGLQLDVLRMDVEDRVPEIRQRMSEIQELLGKAMALVRELSYELNPAVVEKAGLQFALDRLVGRYRKTYGGSLRLMVELTERLPHNIAAALYKIADQALANAVKHSGSQQIEVSLKPTPKGTVLEVRDRGIGFPVELFRDRVPGLGLLLMEYHASEAGLQLSISSRPGEGTTVRALYPAPPPHREQDGNGGKA